MADSRNAQPVADVANSWSEQRVVRLVAGGRGRPLGALVLAAALAVGFFDALAPMSGLRDALFDSYQRLAPRTRASNPAIVVSIDEASLAGIGQWPWPRTVLAQLIDRIGMAHPAAIGIDVLFPEPDRLSPQQLAPIFARTDPWLARRLYNLPSNDLVFARSIRNAPVVLGIAGLDEPAAGASQGRTAPFLVRGGDPLPWLRRFEASLRSLPELDETASGHGLLSVDQGGGVIRRVALVAAVGKTLTPALSVELLRVAGGAIGLGLKVGQNGIEQIAIGDLAITTEADGAVWMHFGPRDATRFVSAIDVLTGRVPSRVFERKLVLIGATGLGLLDYQTTPLGVRMPGVEVHAQLLENIFEGDLLRRPRSCKLFELLLLLAGGVTLLLLIPTMKPRYAAAVFAAVLAVCAGTGIALFLLRGVLFDVASPAVGTTMIFGAVLLGVLADTDRQRRALARALALEREEAARAAGELEAARRIQLGMLPPTSADFMRDRRFELETMLDTAKTVGGDLYDYFKLDNDRLFVLVGDVSGKGLPASIFMAVSKALYKSAALREGGDIGEVMRTAQVEIARDNPEALFVTMFAALLDLRSGFLQYCNAGHEPPLLALPGKAAAKRLLGAEGPPLCVLEDYRYSSATYAMTSGETLCAVTDGVTEAMNADGRLYGRRRLEALVAAIASRGSSRNLLRTIREDVEAHVAGAERSDDVTILVLKWYGTPI